MVVSTTPLTAVDTALDEILEDTAEVMHDEWCVDKKCRLSRSNLVNKHLGEEKQRLTALIGTIAEQARIEGAKAYNRVLTDELGKPTYMDDDGERWSVYKSMWVGSAVRKANEVTIMKPAHPGEASENPEAERLKDYMENKQ